MYVCAKDISRLTSSSVFSTDKSFTNLKYLVLHSKTLKYICYMYVDDSKWTFKNKMKLVFNVNYGKKLKRKRSLH